jgi:hypothetical protein
MKRLLTLLTATAVMVLMFASAAPAFGAMATPTATATATATASPTGTAPAGQHKVHPPTGTAPAEQQQHKVRPKSRKAAATALAATGGPPLVVPLTLVASLALVGSGVAALALVRRGAS